MKKIYLIVVILLPTFIKAQQYIPFPDSNAVWNDIHEAQTSNYTRYGLIGDTTINLMQYHKLFKLSDTILNSSKASYFGAIREQSEKIYLIRSDTSFENLLYDFTKNVGDTLHHLYTETIGNPAFDNYAVITSIDSTLINGSYRKVFHFNNNGNFYWIEGIGSGFGLIYAGLPPIPGYDEWYLVCFKQNGEELYLNPLFNSCFPDITNINEIPIHDDLFNVFPNPITDVSTIYWNNSMKQTYSILTITDLLGRNLKTINISKINNIIICKSDFPSGLYFVKLSDSNKFYIKKIIIQ
jgi:hypothetical protein